MSSLAPIYPDDGKSLFIPEQRPRLPVRGDGGIASQSREVARGPRPQVSLATWRSWTVSRDKEADKQHIVASVNPTGGMTALNRLTKFTEYCDRVEATELQARWEEQYARIRDWIKTMKERDVSQNFIERSQILPRLQAFLDFNNSRARKFLSPWMREELTILRQKWERGDYLCDPNRGLTATHVRNGYGTITKTRYALDKSWEHYSDFKEFGHNELVNGQIWSSRLQLLRDGAHGAKIAGISGTIKDGAYSIVLGTHTKENAYSDIDMQEIIEYEGTALSEKASSANNDLVTAGTGALITSLQTGNPVRVFRVFKVSIKGVDRAHRYDGLYRVTRKTLKDDQRQIWTFRLERLPRQGPIRGGLRGHSTPVNRRSG